MKFSELIERVRGRGVVVGEVRLGEWGGVDPEVTGVAEDSRKVKDGDIFVARGGTKTSGANFIRDALERGAVAVVCSNEIPEESLRAFGRDLLVRAENVNLACAVLAHEVAGNPTSGMKVIGITGTKGKTTVAYLMRSVLKAAGHKVGMIGTVEIDDGKNVVPAEMTTPGSVELVELFCRMRENGVTHCVMEVSSHALHQHRVAGVDFTNLTGDHLDYHKTMEEYAAAKAMLFEGLGEDAVAVVNRDDRWSKRMREKCQASVSDFSLGDRDARWTAGIRNMTSRSMQIAIGGYDPRRSKAVNVILDTPLIGRHNAYNILCVFDAAVELGVDPEVVATEIRHAHGAPGRLQRVYVEGFVPSFQTFVDYAHTHDALENVLKAIRVTMGKSVELSPGEVGASWQTYMGKPERNCRLICLFGCGGDRDRSKRPKMGAVAERLADVVIVTSDNPRTEEPGAIIEEICVGFSAGWKTAGKVTVEPDRRAAIRLAIGMAMPGDVVLLAGKGHENYQIIGTTKHHFDDVEEAEAALRGVLAKSEEGKG